MSDKHTPGPWATFPVDSGSGAETWVVRSRAAPRVNHVASIQWHPVGGEDAANARLIAAAPELLACLQVALECMGGPCPNGGVADTLCAGPLETRCPACRAAAAIAKATGKES